MKRRNNDFIKCSRMCNLISTVTAKAVDMKAIVRNYKTIFSHEIFKVTET